MAPNLSSGTFKIVSLIGGNPPTGIDASTREAFQTVHLYGLHTTWAIDENGRDTYKFSISGRSTELFKDRVVASIYDDNKVDWRPIYHESQDAYTISPVNDGSKGWTIVTRPPPYAPNVGLRPIQALPSNPPTFSPTQLFRFVRVGA